MQGASVWNVTSLWNAWWARHRLPISICCCMTDKLRVLMITSEWPIPQHPEWAPFIVQQAEFLRREGLTVDVFAFRGAKNLLNYASAWLRLRQSHSFASYDLIHA